MLGCSFHRSHWCFLQIFKLSIHAESVANQRLRFAYFIKNAAHNMPFESLCNWFCLWALLGFRIVVKYTSEAGLEHQYDETLSDLKLQNHIYFNSNKLRFTDQEKCTSSAPGWHLHLHSLYRDVQGPCRRKRRAMEIEVSIISAKGLRNADDGWLSGKSDPYCICVSAKKTLFGLLWTHHFFL